MKKRNISIIFALLSAALITCSQTTAKERDKELKPRIVVLTDIAPGSIEPDDMESMVRLMVHADCYEIEALIASGGWNSSGRPYPSEWMDSLRMAIDAYAKDLPNLIKRSNQTAFMPLEQESGQQALGYWPSPEYLKSRVKLGSLNLGMSNVGEGNDSEGSDYIIRLVDESDDRPLWITVWGGGNTLAQAIWHVQQQRSPEELKAFLNKLCVYTITDQDVPWGERHTNYAYSSHQWMRREFEKQMLFIWDESAWLSQNDIGARSWDEYATNIQNHGNLGHIYPKNKYGVEGDTPSFLHVMPNGLNDPTVPDMVGWGGYDSWGQGMDKQTNCWTNHEGEAKQISQKYEKYFYPAIFNNFAARMDWAKEGTGNRNPVVVMNGDSSLKILNLKVKAGKSVTFNASKSYDTDGDRLEYKWWILPEAGTYQGTVELNNVDQPIAKVAAPADASGKTIHVICEVTDNGTPRLTSYRRVIIEIK